MYITEPLSYILEANNSVNQLYFSKFFFLKIGGKEHIHINRRSLLSTTTDTYIFNVSLTEMWRNKCSKKQGALIIVSETWFPGLEPRLTMKKG